MLIITFLSIIWTVYCQAPSVRISQGTVIGKRSTTNNDFQYYEYLQIPYAKPPVGNLRFKSPLTPESWEGERSAKESSDKHVCLQFDIIRNITRGSEDCLYLNVFTPVSPSDTNKKPVMVYIHGGGFTFGDGTIKKEIGPDYLIEHDVILVFINYRLGIFGFLSLDIPEAAGNMGVKDQVMALKWIQDNINNFGGDKNNVTIFGISAGGASVEYLLLSPLSKGLFNKAIIQSGSTLNHWAINYNIKELAVMVARKLGSNSSSDDFQNIYELLFNTDAIQLLTTSLAVINAPMFKGLHFGFVPSIEKDFRCGDTFLSEYPYHLLKEGRFHKVPVMRGFCEFEGYIQAPSIPRLAAEIAESKKFTDFWKYELNLKDKTEFNALFNKIYLDNIKNIDSDKSVINFFGDFDFVSGILTSSKLMSSHGINPYVYEFAYDGNMNMLKKLFKIDRKGASHGDESAYIIDMFDRSQINVTSDDNLTIKRMTKMWTDFAKTGNPTPTTSDIIPIKWPAYNVREEKYLIINKDLEVRSSYEPERIAVFENIYLKYRK